VDLLQDLLSWSFTTAMPELLSVAPETESPWPLDAKMVLAFNQPMDAVSVEANFGLLDPKGDLVPGMGSWTRTFTIFTFTPSTLLPRNTTSP